MLSWSSKVVLKKQSKPDLCGFSNKGWYLSSDIIPSETIANAKSAMAEYYQGRIDKRLPCSEAIANDGHNTNSAIRNNEFVTLQKRAFADLAFHPSILSIVSKLLDTPKIRLFADSLINKKPQLISCSGTVGWHTDKAYWPTCSSNQLLTAWIPLQDVSVEMGPLELITQSNNWHQNQEIKALFGFGKPDLSQLEAKLKELNYPFKKQLMTLKAGQVSFHHCDTIHCSRPNTSNINRVALAVHFQGEKNNYQVAYKDNGEKLQLVTISFAEEIKQGTQITMTQTFSHYFGIMAKKYFNPPHGLQLCFIFPWKLIIWRLHAYKIQKLLICPVF